MDQVKFGKEIGLLKARLAPPGLGNIWLTLRARAEEAPCNCLFIMHSAFRTPIMIVEIYIGRYGRKSLINSVKRIINDFNLNKFWLILGWLGALAGLLILSYYSVIAGIAHIFLIQLLELNPAEYSVKHYSNFKALHLL